MTKAIGEKLRWWRYYYVEKRIRHFPMRLAWKLPWGVVYWCVVRAACRVEPNYPPTDVTAKQMMDSIKPTARVNAGG